MTEASRHRTGHLLQRISLLFVACFTVLALGACATTDRPIDNGEQGKEQEDPVPVKICPDLSARVFERQALELLDEGEDQAAREKLDCALKLNPGSRQASLLLEQLDADPVAYLGSEYFDYTVKSSETLSKIAQLMYGDASRWREIYTANEDEMGASGRLRVGQVLVIPEGRVR